MRVGEYRFCKHILGNRQGLLLIVQGFQDRMLTVGNYKGKGLFQDQFPAPGLIHTKIRRDTITGGPLSDQRSAVGIQGIDRGMKKIVLCTLCPFLEDS
ncbi:hypothetical protein Holit_02947 [Hollandina sp. SP2]